MPIRGRLVECAYLEKFGTIRRRPETIGENNYIEQGDKDRERDIEERQRTQNCAENAIASGEGHTEKVNTYGKGREEERTTKKLEETENTGNTEQKIGQ